ncbi:MAG: radical SAM protein [Candidatus Omnitrophica bacterium]|nr:radical SAM protein [Candidatus Omnitrophota bacterium]
MAKEYPKLLAADENNKIYDIPEFIATGMKGGEYFRLSEKDLIKLHPDSELFVLPDRKPVGYDPDQEKFIQISGNPFASKKGSLHAVAAFFAPGHTTTYSASYKQNKRTRVLPLFSYAAVALYKGEFYASGIRIDNEKRQELTGMPLAGVRNNVKKFRKIFPKNRLVRHLERCALQYGCPAAKNFFLKRYEAPLPTSPACNAKCIGCISHQPEKGCCVTQPRIIFVPTAEEIAEVALFHLKEVKDPVVSFGQGCEGEPLLVGDVLIDAVKLIRAKTGKGIINLNTNASRPDIIKKLFDAGLNSVRVSINSMQEKFYSAYYLPRGYTLKDVLSSVRQAKKKGGFVSLNYLVMPGFTDSLKEKRALGRFLSKNDIDMIQWRNLNYDPLAYFKKLRIKISRREMLGVKELINSVKREYPHLMHGYFNPSRRRMRRA